MMSGCRVVSTRTLCTFAICRLVTIFRLLFFIPNCSIARCLLSGTKQHCGCRSSAWPKAEVLRTRIEGPRKPAGEAAFDDPFQSSTPRSRCNAAIAQHAPEPRPGHLALARLEQHGQIDRASGLTDERHTCAEMCG